MSKNNNLFKNNFIYLRNVFSEIEIKKLKKKIFEDLKYKDLKDRTSHSNANILIKEDFYWDIFKKKEIIDGAKKILLNNNICFIPHTDVQINSKGGIFHRDSAARNFPYGHVWNEVDAKYGVLRVAIYLSSYKDSNSSLLLLKNTNYKENVFQRIETKIYNKLRTFFNKMNLQLPHFSLLSNLVKIKFNPGDVVVFDQRIIHAGGNISFNEPKLSLFFGLGLKNGHTSRHIDWLNQINIKQTAQNNKETGTYVINYDKKFQEFLKMNDLHFYEK